MLKTLLPLTLLPVLAFAQPAKAQQAYGYQDQVDTYDETYGPDPYASREDRFNDDQYRAYRREMARRWRMQHGYPPPGRDYGYQDFNDNGGNDGNLPYAAPVYPVKPQSQAPGKVLVEAGGKPVVTKKKPVTPAKPTVAATASSAPASASAATQPAAPANATASTATAPAAPATATASAAPVAPVLTTPAAAATTAPAKAAATAPAKKGGPVTCDKGASIVSSFGFDKVTNKTCEGASLIYSAERGGKPFEIEVNPKSGELTAVKKL